MDFVGSRRNERNWYNVTYWRVDPGHHGAGDDEAAIPVFRVGLLPEVVYRKFPRVETAIEVDPDNIQVRLRGLSVRVCSPPCKPTNSSKVQCL